MYDLLAYVGGFWKAIFAIGFILSQLLGYEIFVKSVMKRIYHFEKDPNDNEENLSSNSSSDLSLNRDGAQMTKMTSNSDVRRKSFASKLIDEFMRILGQKTHQTYRYSFKDSIMYFLCFPCPRKCSYNYKLRHKIFVTSNQKLLEEMDVIDFIRNMRYLKAIIRILFTRRENQIMWRLRSINLQENLAVFNESQGSLGNFINFRRSGIEKVSADYIN